LETGKASSRETRKTDGGRGVTVCEARFCGGRPGYCPRKTRDRSASARGGVGWVKKDAEDDRSGKKKGCVTT